MDLFDTAASEKLDGIIEHWDVDQREENLHSWAVFRNAVQISFKETLLSSKQIDQGMWSRLAVAKRTLGVSRVVGRNSVVKESANTTACEMLNESVSLELKFQQVVYSWSSSLPGELSPSHLSNFLVAVHHPS